MRQSTPSVFAKNDATMSRPLLCMYPVLFNSRMHASTTGTPVLPSFHALKWASELVDSWFLDHEYWISTSGNTNRVCA